MVQGQTPNVDVTKTLELKKRLECKPFVYFLHRFRKAGLGELTWPEELEGNELGFATQTNPQRTEVQLRALLYLSSCSMPISGDMFC